MILLDKPFVSQFLKDTIAENGITVIDTEASQSFDLNDSHNKVSEQEAIDLYKNKPFLIYTNSENAIDWVNQNLPFSELPGKIDLFKDKFRFREITTSLLPNFFYKKISVDELGFLNYNTLPIRFVLKPVVGFFSMGVYTIESAEQLEIAVKKIKKEIKQVKDLFPKTVLNTNRFIIEEYLEGEEFAFDAFFNAKGEAIVLGIMKHLFASSTDVSDRVYYTSKEIIEEYVPVFEDYLKQLGELIGLKNFPLHVEVRINEKGEIFPIEVNPLRFGAWCTSADLAFHAFGYNSIAHLLKQQKPDWKSILKGKENKRCSIVILNNSTSYSPQEIKSVDYDKILSLFKKPLELRKSDFNKHPHFGFLFVETDENNWNEIEEILMDDLRAYVTTYQPPFS